MLSIRGGMTMRQHMQMKIAIESLESCQTRTWMILFGIESLGELLCKTVTVAVPLNF